MRVVKDADPYDIKLTLRRDGSHTAVFGPSTALTVHRTVIHYRLARSRYVPDRPFLLLCDYNINLYMGRCFHTAPKFRIPNS